RRSPRSGPDRGRFQLHPARARHEVELQLDELGRAERIVFREHVGEAAAEAALQRAHALPLEAIDRIAGRVPLRDDAAAELPARIVVVAVRAAEVELALPFQEEGPARGGIGGDFYGKAARLPADESGQGEQLAAFVGERLRLLPLDAA